MKIEGLNHWFTLAANLGVIAGIVFLGLEIQQNTRMMQATAIQASTDISRQQILLFATDAETNRIAMIGTEDPTNLTPEEKQRYFWMNRSFWLGMQGLYRQWELGVLPDEEWAMWTRIICRNLSSGGGEALWPGNTNTLIPAFINWVDETCKMVDEIEGVMPQYMPVE